MESVERMCRILLSITGPGPISLSELPAAPHDDPKTRTTSKRYRFTCHDLPMSPAPPIQIEASTTLPVFWISCSSF